MIENLLWRITPGGLLSLVIILMLAGCAPVSTRAELGGFEARDCVLGVAHAEEVMKRQVFHDPVDALITAAVDSPHGSWQCPADARS